MYEPDSKALAASLVSLVEDSAPSRLQFIEDAGELIESWVNMKPQLVALGAFDNADDVRQAANDLRDAGNELFDLLATTQGELKVSETEDLLTDFPKLHERATDAAQKLLDVVAAT
jgi:hypothetical protein